MHTFFSFAYCRRHAAHTNTWHTRSCINGIGHASWGLWACGHSDLRSFARRERDHPFNEGGKISRIASQKKTKNEFVNVEEGGTHSNLEQPRRSARSCPGRVWALNFFGLYSIVWYICSTAVAWHSRSALFTHRLVCFGLFWFVWVRPGLCVTRRLPSRNAYSLAQIYAHTHSHTPANLQRLI